MARKVISGNAKVDTLGLAMFFSIQAGTLAVNLTPTIWKAGGQALVNGGKIIITSPSGRIISAGTSNVFLPPSMSQTAQFNLPKIGGITEWGVYNFRLTVDSDPNLVLDYSFELCAPFDNENNDGKICMQVVSDCDGGLVKIYSGTVGYKGYTPYTINHSYKFYYPSGSNQPAVNIFAFPVQLSLITGDNKIDGSSLASYVLPDDVTVYANYIGTEEKFISCTFPCHLLCAYDDLVKQVNGLEMGSREFSQAYQKLFQVQSYISLISFGYHCGKDMSDEIEFVADLLGVGGGCCPNVNSGSTTTTTTAATTTTTTSGTTTSTTTGVGSTTTTTTFGTTTSTTTSAPCPTVTDIVMSFIDPNASTTTTTTAAPGQQLATPTLGRLGLGPTSTSIKISKDNSAEVYTLQRATNSSFTAGLTTLYSGTIDGLMPEFANLDYCVFHDDAAHGLIAGSTYYYRARTHDNNGIFADSNWSNAKQIVLPAANKLVTYNGNGGGMFGNGIEGDPNYLSFWNGTAVVPVYAGDEIALSNPGVGSWSYFSLADFHGTPSQPVTIRNQGQVVMTAGFELTTCTYINISGKHASKTETRGFNIQGSGNGACYVIKGLCQYILVEGLKTSGSWYSGIVKNEVNSFATDPDCGAWMWWPHRMTNIELRDIDSFDHAQDNIYAGSSGPLGHRPFDCHGVTIDVRPTGFANMHFHHLNITRCGRQGIQLGNWDAGVNHIHDCVITECGFEMNNAQGAGIAVGGGMNSLEIDHCTITRTWREAIYSYHFGQLHIHDIITDQIGTITNDPTRDIFFTKITLAGGQTLSSVWMNSSPGLTITDSLGEYYFEFYANQSGNPLIKTQKRVTSPSRTAAQAIAAIGTIPPGAHAGNQADPFVGFGASSAITTGQVSTPADVSIPYGMTNFMINTFSGNEHMAIYGDPAGRTRFRIENNTLGTQTGGAAILFLQSFDTYGAPNTICNNTYLGNPLTNDDVYSLGVNVTWTTDCSTTTTTTTSGTTTTTTTAGTTTTTTTASGTTTTTTAGTTTTTTTSAPGMLGRMRIDQFRRQVWPEYTYGLIWVPTDYDAPGNTTKYPLLVWGHGAGATGDGISGLNNLYIEGFPKNLNDNPGWNVEAVNPVDGLTYKFIVVCAQAPTASFWSYGYGNLINIIDDVKSRYRVDPDRVYMTGLSAGGTGAISLVSNSQSTTETIAAIVPIAAAGFNNGTEDTNWPLVGGTWGVKMWDIVGNDDAWKVFNTSLVDRFNGASPAPATPAVQTVMASPAGHNPACWDVATGPNWRTNAMNNTIYEWCLRYKRNISGTTTTTTAGTTTTTTTASGTTTTTTAGTTTTTTTSAGTTTTTTAGTTTTTTTAAGGIPTAKFNLSATTQNVSGWNNFTSGGNTTAIPTKTVTDSGTGWDLKSNAAQWFAYIGFTSSNGDGGSSAGSPAYTAEFPSAAIQGTFINTGHMFVPGQSVWPFEFNNLQAGTYELLIQGSIKASVIASMPNGIFYARFGTGSDIHQDVSEQSNASNQFVTLTGTITAGQKIQFGLFTETANAGNANVINAIILRKTS